MGIVTDPAAEIIDRLPGWLVDVIEQRHGRRISDALLAEAGDYDDDTCARLVLELAAAVARSVRVVRAAPAAQQVAP